MKRCALLLLLSSLLFAPVQAQEIPPDVDFGPRTWTNTEGRKIEAQVESADDSIVRLKLLATGKIVNVPLSKLSEDDRKYAKDWLLAKTNSWSVEILSSKEVSSYKPYKAPGSSFAGTPIKPSDKDSGLMLLLIRVTPPPDVPIGSFAAENLAVKVQADSKLVTAVRKYVLPERSKDLDDYGAGDRGIVYQIPRRARLAGVKYNRPKLRPKQ